MSDRTSTRRPNLRDESVNLDEVAYIDWKQQMNKLVAKSTKARKTLRRRRVLETTGLSAIESQAVTKYFDPLPEAARAQADKFRSYLRRQRAAMKKSGATKAVPTRRRSSGD